MRTRSHARLRQNGPFQATPPEAFLVTGDRVVDGRDVAPDSHVSIHSVLKSFTLPMVVSLDHIGRDEDGDDDGDDDDKVGLSTVAIEEVEVAVDDTAEVSELISGVWDKEVIELLVVDSKDEDQSDQVPPL